MKRKVKIKCNFAHTHSKKCVHSLTETIQSIWFFSCIRSLTHRALQNFLRIFFFARLSFSSHCAFSFIVDCIVFGVQTVRVCNVYGAAAAAFVFFSTNTGASATAKSFFEGVKEKVPLENEMSQMVFLERAVKEVDHTNRFDCCYYC